MDLKCRNLDCENNDRYSCTRKGIIINNHSYCKDYKKTTNLSEDQQQNVPKTMFEKEAKLHPYRHNKTVDIECGADCLFNHNGKCLANGIAVQNLNPKNAKCTTFMKK